MKEQNDTNTQATTKKNLSFKIEKQTGPITGLYSYGVRPFVKNIDILGYHLGLSPEGILEMLKKNKFFKSGRLWLGYWEGTGKKFYIDISINNDTVIWKGWCEFNKAEYTSAIQEMQKMLTDHLVKYEKKFKEYKKAIYEWLTQKMGIPATVAKSQIKFYEKRVLIEQDFMQDCSVPSIAKRLVGEEEV